MGLAPARAQPSATAVKAAFIPKFARYVQWPQAAQPGPGRPYIVCLIGADPFGAAIDRAAASEQIEGRSVAVRRLPGAAGAEGCHIAFIRLGSSAATAQILRALASHPVLTVTDAEAGTARGMIHFVIADGRVRFYVDEAFAAGRGLAISSRLLALAISVRQRRG